MIKIGIDHTLRIERDMGTGLYLAHESEEEPIFLPYEDAPIHWEQGDSIEVFVYKDNKGNLMGTTKQPKIKLNEFAYLRVKHIGEHGAFLDWGLDKDLFVPYRQQARSLEEGNRYIVLMFLDEYSNRLVGSTKYNWYLKQQEISVKEGDQVELLITERTEIGVSVIINHKHKGLLYKNEVFKDIRRGDKHIGYVKSIREDGKIDVSLQKQGYIHIASNTEGMLEHIKQNGGYIPLTDKSPPQEIADHLEMSKKAFKKIIGALYKQRKIRIEADGIYLNE